MYMYISVNSFIFLNIYTVGAISQVLETVSDVLYFKKNVF